MKVSRFDTLKPTDFGNGAILDDIRGDLKRLEYLEPLYYRLREGIEKHREDMWGKFSTVDHVIDSELYKLLDEPEGGKE